MAQVNLTHGISHFTGGFTFPGKYRSPASALELGTAAAMLMVFAVAGPAAAVQQIGPTSSAIVGISLSVAPKYGLRDNAVGIDALESEAANFCIATNGRPTGLPIHLAWQTVDVSAAGRNVAEAVAQLDWCAAGGRSIQSIDRGDHGEEAALLIVRPE
jgi:hypothetical protein